MSKILSLPFFIMSFIFIGCVSSTDEENIELKRQLTFSQKELKQYKDKNHKQMSETLAMHEVDWKGNNVIVKTCSLMSSYDSITIAKNELILNAKSEAIEALHTELTSAFESENMCENYEDGNEGCQKYISQKVNSFSKGSLQQSKYQFTTKDEVVCIEFTALVRPDIIDKDTPVITARTYAKEEYSTTITNPIVLYSMAYNAYVNADFKRAFFYSKVLSDQGDTNGYFNLGALYAEGKGIDKDYQKAKFFYTKACNSGDMTGCYNLAILYSNGEGLEQNLYKARALYAKACDGNCLSSCYNLAVLYTDGKGVEKDFKKAKSLYTKACDGGEKLACSNLGRMYNKGDGVALDYQKAYVLFKKSCEDGEFGGCYGLGLLYVKGDGVEQNYQRANSLFSIACNNGSSPACQSLGIHYYLGLGLAKNTPKAKEFFKKACEYGSSEGCKNYKILNAPKH